MGNLLVDKIDVKDKKIDLSPFKNGIYILNINTKNGSYITEIVKV